MVKSNLEVAVSVAEQFVPRLSGSGKSNKGTSAHSSDNRPVRHHLLCICIIDPYMSIVFPSNIAGMSRFDPIN